MTKLNIDNYDKVMFKTKKRDPHLDFTCSGKTLQNKLDKLTDKNFREKVTRSINRDSLAALKSIQKSGDLNDARFRRIVIYKKQRVICYKVSYEPSFKANITELAKIHDDTWGLLR